LIIEFAHNTRCPKTEIDRSFFNLPSQLTSFGPWLTLVDFSRSVEHKYCSAAK